MPVKSAPAANLDAETSLCLDCGESFVPTRRWGKYPGLYRRCTDCRESKRIARRVQKRKPTSKPVSYLKIRDYLWLQYKYQHADLSVSDAQISVATGIPYRTVKRIIARMRKDNFIETTISRIKLNDTTWINHRSIQLNIKPPQKEEE